MAWFGRSLPEQVRDGVTLARGERVLTYAETPTGWMVATTHALWVPGRRGLTRLGWETVETAAWDRDSSTLHVLGAGVPGQRPRRWDVRLDDERDLLLVIKERVRATVITTRRVALAGGRGATVVARRPPGEDRVTWAVSVDPGLDPEDHELRATVEQVVEGLRRELGQ